LIRRASEGLLSFDLRSANFSQEELHCGLVFAQYILDEVKKNLFVGFNQ
jgi:hypothetical protein